MTTLLPSVFEAFTAQIGRIRARRTDPDPDVAFLAKTYLETLASKSGNDILESLLVHATGRELKAIGQKHGADSADGELEAKPMKCGYSAHISDDTPASLLRHQQIPWIVLGEACSDGTEIKWACLAPYRIFDEARFQNLVTELPPETRFKFTTLPLGHAERYATLTELKRCWPTKKYIRSSPLPYTKLVNLAPGQYSLWSTAHAPAEIKEMAMIQSSIHPDTIAATTGIRDYFAAKATSDYANMNLTQLKAICREKGFRGLCNKSKEELLILLTD